MVDDRIVMELEDVIDVLTEREQRILAMLYGLGEWKQKSYKEVAKEYGATVERIQRAEQCALHKLQHPTRRK